MPPKIKSTLPVKYGQDLYELVVGGPVEVEVIFYRRGLDGMGLMVDFDQLAHDVQIKLYDRLKKYLDKQKTKPKQNEHN